MNVTTLDVPLWVGHDSPRHFTKLSPSSLFDELIPILQSLNTQEDVFDVEETLIYLGLGFKYIAVEERAAGDIKGIELDALTEILQFSEDYIKDLVESTASDTTVNEYILLTQALEQQLKLARDKFTTGVVYLPGVNESHESLKAVYCLYARHLITASLLCQKTLFCISQSATS